MWYVIGRIRLKPGRRAAFLEAAKPLIDATRQEPGCIFFETAVSPDDPDGMLVAHCYRDEAAHTAHLETAHVRAFRPRFEADLLTADYEDIVSDTVKYTHHGS
jgi:quinol monooxygenase YgiN